MTAFVFEDADYSFPKSHYQVEGELGYAAVSAWEPDRYGDATMEVRPPSLCRRRKKRSADAGARFFLVVTRRLWRWREGQERMLWSMQAGSRLSDFALLRRASENLLRQKMELFSIPGAQNNPRNGVCGGDDP